MASVSKKKLSLQYIINRHSIHWYCLKCWISSSSCQLAKFVDGCFSCKAVKNSDCGNFHKMPFRSSFTIPFYTRSLGRNIFGLIPNVWTPLRHSYFTSGISNLYISSNYMSTSSRNKDNYKQDSDKTNEDNEKNDKDILENDAELRSILNDIMKDFEGPPPPSPGTAGKLPSDKKHVDDNSKVAPDIDKIVIENPERNSDDKTVIPLSMKDKFKEYSDRDATLILGAEEQFAHDVLDELQEEPEFYLYQQKDEFNNLQLERGETGVFDLPELVGILKSENLCDIAVIEVPENLHYTDYLVIGTAKAPRHLRGVSEFIRKLYKMKKHKKDPYPFIEGAGCQDWKVIDMGNIVLHIFLAETRSHYQIETLWTVGEQYDDLVHQKMDPVFDLLQQHMQFVKKMQAVEPDQQVAKLGT